MRYRRLLVVFISSLIVLLTLAAIARADSPKGRTRLGDHLNLNALDKANNQAGFTLFNQDDPQPDGEDGEDADNNGDDTGGNGEYHPVANELVKYFSKDDESGLLFDDRYEEVMSLHEMGFGFGAITKAFFLAEMLNNKNLESDLVTLLDRARQEGWGNVLKTENIHPGSLNSVGTVMGNRPEHAGPPDHAGPPEHAGKKSGTGPELEQNSLNGGLSGPGSSGNPAKGQGQTNGNGKAKGKNK